MLPSVDGLTLEDEFPARAPGFPDGIETIRSGAENSAQSPT